MQAASPGRVGLLWVQRRSTTPWHGSSFLRNSQSPIHLPVHKPKAQATVTTATTATSATIPPAQVLFSHNMVHYSSVASMVLALSSWWQQPAQSAFHPVVIKGHRFFDAVTGDAFGIRGVNYYPRPNTGDLDVNNLDLFSQEFAHIWKRDIPQFAALSANAVRLYAVDPEKNHDAFMCTLQSLGIYVVVDLASSCDGCEITPDEVPACYPASYKVRGQKIISQFSKYDNVIAFSGGNEINHRTKGNGPEWNAPCQKKFIRDMREYIQSCPSMRQIPMGLVVADTDRVANAQYYNCRTNPSDELENAQWYGINVYVHCDDISDETKAEGYKALRKSFQDLNYSIPVVLTEFGCTSKGFPTIDGYQAQRTFHDAKWMNSGSDSDTFAGGFAFEYSTENANSKSTAKYPFTTFGPQNYGLGFFAPEDCDDVNVKCKYERMPNFKFLAEAYRDTDTSDQPNLKSFEVATNRKSPSKCPATFGKLADFTWESDAQASIACPTTKVQCPTINTGSIGSAGSVAADLLKNGDLGSSSQFQVEISELNGTAPDQSAGAKNSSQTSNKPAKNTNAAAGSNSAVVTLLVGVAMALGWVL